MTTLRRRIVVALADLLDTAVDWDVVTRGLREEVATTTRKAIVYYGAERKRADTPNRVTADLEVFIRVIVSIQAAGELETADEVLDESLAELERLIPVGAVGVQPAEALGVPGVQLVDVSSIRLDAPDEQAGNVSGSISVDVRYVHDLGEPDTIGGAS